MERALETLVRDRARGRCEYCRGPEQFSSTPFQIDHVVAEQHGGATSAPNLALACFACNHHKGPNLGGIDPKTAIKTWLFNPRRHKSKRRKRTMNGRRQRDLKSDWPSCPTLGCVATGLTIGAKRG